MDRRRTLMLCAVAAALSIIVIAGCVQRPGSGSPATASLEREERAQGRIWMYRFQPPRPKAEISQSTPVVPRFFCG